MVAILFRLKVGCDLDISEKKRVQISLMPPTHQRCRESWRSCDTIMSSEFLTHFSILSIEPSPRQAAGNVFAIAVQVSD